MANVSKERGEKRQPWQPEPAGPGLASRRHMCPPGREGEEELGEKGGEGNARPWPLRPPATTSQVMVGDGICNSWECDGFSWRPFSILTLFLEALGVPFMLTGALSGRYIFLWNVTFSRDRGWQRCDQGAFILLLIPTDALLSP